MELVFVKVKDTKNYRQFKLEGGDGSPFGTFYVPLTAPEAKLDTLTVTVA